MKIILASALAVTLSQPGAESEKYIQSIYKLSPSNAAALSIYAQGYSLECKQYPTISKVKRFETSKVFLRLSKSAPVGIRGFMNIMSEYGQTINCK